MVSQNLITSCQSVPERLCIFVHKYLSLTKSVLFLGLINNDNASTFNYTKAFYSFSSSPQMSVYLAFIIIILSFAFLFKGRSQFLVSCEL